jgi:predicted AAA+ superfamily ATPase
LLENLVLSDLMAWRDSALVARPGVFYWRTATGEEVDFVIERHGELIGVEVKATARPRLADAAHLQVFRDEYGSRVRGCLLLHGGDKVQRLAPGIVSAPWWRVL